MRPTARIGTAWWDPCCSIPTAASRLPASYRNLGAPEWFDHRYRFKPPSYGPANVPDTALAVTGACMYLRRCARSTRSAPSTRTIRWASRTWTTAFVPGKPAGRFVTSPAARLTHVESPTRGTVVGERERRSQEHFWDKWGAWFDGREVRTADDALRVVYVTQDTGVGGGHRDVFEHLNRLRARGHEVGAVLARRSARLVLSRGPGATLQELRRARRGPCPLDAIKVATWWETAPWVWRASVTRGIPVYFVQDIETSYYPGDASAQNRVLASYREEFRYMTISGWNRERLGELGLSAELIPPGIDLDNFRRLDRPKRDDVVLADRPLAAAQEPPAHARRLAPARAAT